MTAAPSEKLKENRLRRGMRAVFTLSEVEWVLLEQVKGVSSVAMMAGLLPRWCSVRLDGDRVRFWLVIIGGE